MYSFKAFRRDLEELHTQTLRTMRLGWFSRWTMAFMKLPADWHQVRDQAILDLHRSRELAMRVLDGIEPFLSLDERNGTSAIGTQRILAIANQAKMRTEDMQNVLELYRSLSNSEWRGKLLATIAGGRRATFYGNVVGLCLVSCAGVGIAFLYWAARTLLSSRMQ